MKQSFKEFLLEPAMTSNVASIIKALPWIEDLGESLNTRFDAENWHREDEVDVGSGLLGDEEFKIMIHPQSYSFDDHQYKFANVSFTKIVDGQESEELQLTSKNASKIIGAVTHAIQDRIKLYDLDAIVFIAQDHIEKRMRLYNIIARKKWAGYGLGRIIENIDIGGGRRLTAMISKELSQHVEGFKAHLAGISK